MKITFYGAARQVTGSMFLLELKDGYKILIDCGIDFDRKGDKMFQFDPSEIDLVLLTHAHLDHSGNIPHLFMNGYSGQVLCTSATFDLTQLILNDAAALSSKNIKRKLNRKKFGTRKISDADNLENHIQEASERFVPIAFNYRFEIKENLYVTFIPTGHLLGASNIYLEVKEDEKWKKIGFTGDIGRKDYPLLEDPNPFPEVDFLVCETTYGNRLHTEQALPKDLLLNIIKKACVDIKGRLIIPSFSVGRTQALLFTLNQLNAENKLPAIKVFADSPMAEACTRIYENHLSILNTEAKDFYQKNGSLFDFDNLVSIRSSKESKAVSNYHEPCIILSSSGMITGGRIQDHIRKNLDNQYCTILLVGYCAEGTTGYSLYNGEKFISVKGRPVTVKANIIYTDVFSGHADQGELLEFVKRQNAKSLKKIFLVHGEEGSMISFSNKLKDSGYNDIQIPFKEDTFILD